MLFRIFSAITLFLFVGCASVPTVTSSKMNNEGSPSCFNGFPDATLIDHKYFKICYDKSIRSPRYVKYILTKESLTKKVAERRNKFIPDPLLVKDQLPFVSPQEYAHTGYDRGHMAPSADFQYSQEANDATFVMSNMEPQTKNLNERSWAALEAQVRRWACGEERLIVITGPIFKGNLKTLPSGLLVPQKFFKIIIDDTEPRKVAAFVYDQNDEKEVKYSMREVAINKLDPDISVILSTLGPNYTGNELSGQPPLSTWKEADCN